MGSVIIVWIVSSLSGAFGVFLALHLPSTVKGKIWSWGLFGLLTLAALAVAIWAQEDQNAKDQAQAVSMSNLQKTADSSSAEIVSANGKLDNLASVAGISVKGGLNDKLDYLISNFGPTKDAVANLANISEAERDYHDVALLNMIGKPALDGDISYNTPISVALEGSYDINGTHVTFHQDAQAEQKFRNVIALEPKFPFSYVALGVILFNRGDVSWRDYYLKAQAILEKTTLVPGHNSNHDDFLKRIAQRLSQTTPQSSVPDTSAAPR